MKKLKKSYHKAFFTLIKAYKRYYLGAQLLKIPFYKLISKQTKLAKWQEKREQRREFLQNALKKFKAYKHNLNYFKQKAQAIKEWQNSQEFKQKYLDTKHPYPPLLNPDKIDYAAIPAELAWEMSLPLPKGYKFLCVMASFNAHTSMVNYLQKCGVSIMQDHTPDAKQHYIFDYSETLKNSFSAINITAYTGSNEYYKDLKKLILMTNNKSPILWIVRCPMQRLIASLNNSWSKPNVINDFDENTPLTALECRKDYWIDKLQLGDRIKESIKGNTFTYAKLYNFFTKHNFTKHAFLDMQNYKEPQEIFELFGELSRIYGFSSPRCEDDFSYRFRSLYSGFIPLTSTLNGVKFTLGATKSEQAEVSQMLNLQKDDFTRDILVYVDDKNVAQVKQNKDKIKPKIQAIMDKLAQVLEYEVKHNQTSKETLMAFLQTHSSIRKLLREIFSKEVEFIRHYRPDIVASWSYYNEFEKMCAELDSADSTNSMDSTQSADSKS